MRAGALLGKTFGFAGRVAGLLVTIALVRRIGATPALNGFVVANAATAMVTGSVASSVEVQGIREIARDRCCASSVTRTAAVLGAGAAVVAAALVAGAAGIVGDSRASLAYGPPLVLAVPLAVLFAALLADESVHGRWGVAGVLGIARIVPATVAAFLVPPTVTGIAVVAWALVGGELARLGGVLAWRAARPLHGSLCPRRRAHGYARHVLWQVPAGLLSSLNPTIDRFLVTSLAIGSAALLDVGEKGNGLVVLVFTQAVLPILYRRWAIQSAEGSEMRWVREAGRVLGVMTVVVAVVALAAVAGGDTALSAVIGGGHGAVLRTFMAFLLGTPAYVAGQVLVRALVIRGKAPLLLPLTVGQVVLNVGLDLLVGPRLGLPGIALATSATAWLGLIGALVLVLRSRETRPARMSEPVLAA